MTATSTVQTNRPPAPPPDAHLGGAGRARGRRPVDRVPHAARPGARRPRTSRGARPTVARRAGPARRRRPARCARWSPTRWSTEPGATDVQHRRGGAWEQRAGVCQDMVAPGHRAGCARSGIPARYVSGYFHPSAEPGGRRARRRRVARLGGVVGRRLAPVRPDHAQESPPTGTSSSRTAATTPTSSRSAGIYSGAATSHDVRRGRGHPAGLTPPPLSHWSRGWAGRATASAHPRETGDAPPRNVRAPQGKVVGNTHPG